MESSTHVQILDKIAINLAKWSWENRESVCCAPTFGYIVGHTRFLYEKKENSIQNIFTLFLINDHMTQTVLNR